MWRRGVCTPRVVNRRDERPGWSEERADQVEEVEEVRTVPRYGELLEEDASGAAARRVPAEPEGPYVDRPRRDRVRTALRCEERQTKAVELAADGVERAGER